MPLAVDAPTRERSRGLPALARFLESLEDPLADARASLALLAGGDFPREALRFELARLASNPAHVPGANGEGLTLARGAGFQLALRLLRPMSRPAGELASLTEHLDVACCGPAPLVFDLYREPAFERPDVLDRTQRLAARGRLTLARGEAMSFVAASDLPVPRPEAITFALVLGRPAGETFQRIYAAPTLVPTRLVSAEPTASRLEFTAVILGELGDESCVPALEKLAKHPAHFVRWSALEALARVSPEVGLTHVERALDDPHPHIRRAARRTLDAAEESR